MRSRALVMASLVAACALLSLSCGDDASERPAPPKTSQESAVSRANGASRALEGPAFSPVFYYAGPNPDGSSYVSVFTISSAPGGVYGLFGLAAFCDDSELNIAIYYLPPTSLKQVAVKIRVDDVALQHQRWDVSKTYAATLGYSASLENAETLLVELVKASHVEIELPELAVGPARPDVNALLQTPVQERLERCRDEKSTDVIEMKSDYLPIADREGSVSDEVSYKAESLRGNRLQTTVTYADPNHQTALGRVEFVLTCTPDGNFNVELANLPRPTEQGTGELQELRVVVRLDRQPPREESWSMYSLSDGVEARSQAPWSLMQALARSSSLLLSMPELGISVVAIDLPEMFSTPVQDNLSHCGYYGS